MLEPTIVHDYKKATPLFEAPDRPVVLPFKAFIFENDGEGGPSMDLLRDLKLEYGGQCKLILYKTSIKKEARELFGVIFDTVIDHDMLEKQALPPNPAPNAFTKTLADIDVDPEKAVAFVTTINGSLAANAAGVGLIVASPPDALKREDDFRSNGSDALSWDRTMTIGQLSWLYQLRVEDTSWQIHYFHYNAEREILRETLTSVGNGYMGVRGSCDWVKSDGQCKWHYPATYLAGTYNTNPSIVHGKEILNSDLVNCPNWTLIELRIGQDEQWTNPLQHKLIEYSHGFDLAIAQMERAITFEDSKGRRTRISTKRIASMKAWHRAASVFSVMPLNYSEPVTIRSSIDGDVYNHGVKRYMALNQEHLKVTNIGQAEGGMYLIATTVGRHEQIDICMFAQHHAFQDRVPTPTKSTFEQTEKVVSMSFTFEGKQGVNYTVEKIVSIFTSKDMEVKGHGRPVLDVAIAELREKPFFAQLAVPHRIRWRQIWDRMDIQIRGDRTAFIVQKMARMHLYHLLASFSDNNAYVDAGFTARGLTGESYRGHVFWDEIYLFPTYNICFPEASKAHLRYRTQRIDAAKRYAKENGYQGAMIPWQTSDYGDEETQVVHYNPLSGKWDPDQSCRQRHVGIAVFFDGWSYFQATNDQEFLAEDLGVLMLEITRFWASISKQDPSDGRVHIEGVMGPDEYHEHVLAKDGGVIDNAYTNLMVVWLMDKALKIVRGQVLNPAATEKLVRRVGITQEEIQWWETLTKKMAVCIRNGVLEQFKGYFDLKELDWEGYRAKYKDIRRLDRIMKKEGVSPDEYQLAKQADTLMLYYLLTPEEVANLLRGLGYTVDDPVEFCRRNYDYYQARTSHGSTLSYTVHAKIAYIIGRSDVQWQWFMEAANSDVFDRQFTTHEGIHCGVMAGTLDMLLSNFVGLREQYDGSFSINPALPPKWEQVKFNRLLRGRWYHFEITKDFISISLQGPADFAPENQKPLLFRVSGCEVTVGPWRPVQINYALTRLKDFYSLMSRTKVIRADILQRVFSGREVDRSLVTALQHVRDRLLTIPREGPRPVLDVDKRTQLRVDLSYEISSLNRDLQYLQDGETIFVDKVMRKAYKDWDETLAAGEAFLKAVLQDAPNKKFANLISDRDGTTNLYCDRYLSSVQAAYNAIWLSRFAKHCCAKATFITSAPLGDSTGEDNGIVGISVNPPGFFIYAASKGREYYSDTLRRMQLPMSAEHTSLMEALNKELGKMLKLPAWEKFSWIGSGFQTKFGETVVARQDIGGSITRPESLRLKAAVQDVMRTVDPTGKQLAMHDTGLDLEIFPTRKGGQPSFTKGDGVDVLDKELDLNVAAGPNLVCGDTSSDIPMIVHAMKKSSNTCCIFVTSDQVLAAKVRSTCPKSLIVPTPDHLVGILNRTALAMGAAEGATLKRNAKL
eukprot:TRINITY_DN15175_c0_g1_i1.p1 TRINITY_DN15175_c0_g1~~TRINITY_DN15175_c0_g1_i1.p1  ORF type:complete len:1417 (+),score=564.59 TRINITY_DN15175_c0_g1_i1:126-4376(+)